MKATGIVRKVDELGRAVLPIELRRMLDIQEGTALEIFVEGKTVILRKYAPGCVLCGATQAVTTWKDKLVCQKCLAELHPVAPQEQQVIAPKDEPRGCILCGGTMNLRTIHNKPLCQRCRETVKKST